MDQSLPASGKRALFDESSDYEPLLPARIGGSTLPNQQAKRPGDARTNLSEQIKVPQRGHQALSSRTLVCPGMTQPLLDNAEWSPISVSVKLAAV